MGDTANFYTRQNRPLPHCVVCASKSQLWDSAAIPAGRQELAYRQCLVPNLRDTTTRTTTTTLPYLNTSFFVWHMLVVHYCTTTNGKSGSVSSRRLKKNRILVDAPLWRSMKRRARLNHSIHYNNDQMSCDITYRRKLRVRAVLVFSNFEPIRFTLRFHHKKAKAMIGLTKRVGNEEVPSASCCKHSVERRGEQDRHNIAFVHARHNHLQNLCRGSILKVLAFDVEHFSAGSGIYESVSSWCC